MLSRAKMKEMYRCRKTARATGRWKCGHTYHQIALVGHKLVLLHHPPVAEHEEADRTMRALSHELEKIDNCRCHQVIADLRSKTWDGHCPRGLSDVLTAEIRRGELRRHKHPQPRPFKNDDKASKDYYRLWHQTEMMSRMVVRHLNEVVRRPGWTTQSHPRAKLLLAHSATGRPANFTAAVTYSTGLVEFSLTIDVLDWLRTIHHKFTTPIFNNHLISHVQEMGDGQYGVVRAHDLSGVACDGQTYNRTLFPTIHTYHRQPDGSVTFDKIDL